MDSSGITYGVRCNTTLAGIVITTSGKPKRAVALSLEGCLAACDAWGPDPSNPGSKSDCAGVSYDEMTASCEVYDTIQNACADGTGSSLAMYRQ